MVGGVFVVSDWNCERGKDILDEEVVF